MITSALLFGILGSFHCIGMCGPIAFMLPLDHSNPKKKGLQVALYHLGRITTYSLIGLLFGLIGKSLSLFGWQQQLSIAIGVSMLLIVIFPRIFSGSIFKQPVFGFVSYLKSSWANLIKQKSFSSFWTMGFLNGFLPCGLVYVAVFAAVALGNSLQGSLYMLLFGLGTVPLMTLTVYLGNFLSISSRKFIRRMIPVFVAIFGFWLILRGLGLDIAYLSPRTPVWEVGAKVDCPVPQNPLMAKDEFQLK
ncbi:MAG: sulfite exporter TauE/SafE family protein [Flavobacteriaceae bacterium]|nr:sulfite exporter TauE/SafE family protein [Flavobacteriaceae bacterium]